MPKNDHYIRLEYDARDHATIKAAAGILGRPAKTWAEQIVIAEARKVVEQFKTQSPPVEGGAP